MTQNQGRPWYPNDPGPPPSAPIDTPLGWGTGASESIAQSLKRHKRAVIVVAALVLGVFAIALAASGVIQNAISNKYSVGDCLIATGSITQGSDLKDTSCSNSSAYRVTKVLGLHDSCPTNYSYEYNTDITFRDETSDTTYCLSQIGFNTGGD